MKRILIVEDEFILANRLSEILLQKKVADECLTADNYSDAIALIKKELPDLVLLDIQLFEDQDAGIRIAYYLQEHYHIPFIFLSGHSQEAMLRRAKLYGPVTFIEKPFLENQVLVTVKMAMPEGEIHKLKAVELKGKYFTHTTLEQLYHTDFSRYDFIRHEIDFSKISIIQSFNHIKRNTVLLQYANEKDFFLLNCTIEKILEILPCFFMQVHQSYVVNKEFITGSRRGEYILIKDQKIPVGVNYTHQEFLS